MEQKSPLVSIPATGPTGTASIFGENFREPGEWMGIFNKLGEKVHRAFPMGTELPFWFFMACFWFQLGNRDKHHSPRSLPADCFLSPVSGSISFASARPHCAQVAKRTRGGSDLTCRACAFPQRAQLTGFLPALRLSIRARLKPVLELSRTSPRASLSPSSLLGHAADWRSLEGMAHPWGHPGSWGSFQTMFRKGVQGLLKRLCFFFLMFGIKNKSQWQQSRKRVSCTQSTCTMTEGPLRWGPTCWVSRDRGAAHTGSLNTACQQVVIGLRAI